VAAGWRLNSAGPSTPVAPLHYRRPSASAKRPASIKAKLGPNLAGGPTVDSADAAAGPRLTRHRDFMKLWAAQTVSAFGARISREGLPLAAVLTLHAGPAALGILAALSRGSAMAVGLFAGGLVDRSSRRSIMVASDLIRAVLLAAVPVIALLHHLTIWVVYAIALLVGAASVLFDIADQAFLPSLVRKDQLMEANSRLATTDGIAETAGPAIAGGLVQLLGAPFALAVNAITYLVSAVFLGSLRKVEDKHVPAEDAEPPNRLSDLIVGFRALNADPVVRAVAVVMLIQGLFGGVFSALYMIFAIRVVGLAPGLLGITIAVGGLGALIGAALGPWLTRRIGMGPMAAFTTLAYGLGLAFIPLAPGPGPHGSVVAGTGFMMASQLVGDAFGTACIVGLTSLRQGRLRPEIMGRAGAALAAGTGALLIVGALGGGGLAQLIGMRPAMWVAVAGFALAGVWAIASPIRRAEA
jgi:predicted MFS family arabinose efflux permease